MISHEIRTNAIALGALMHQVGPEQAAMLRLIRTNLMAAVDHAQELERSLVAPQPEGPVNKEEPMKEAC
jgi:ribosome biogenesis protein Tsr3